MTDLIMWPAVILSLIGMVANIRRLRSGFLFWIVANAGWIAYDISLGAWSQAALFAVYEGMAIWGWFAWRSRPRPDSSAAVFRPVRVKRIILAGELVTQADVDFVEDRRP